jgi:hypothetical protein
MTGYLFIVVVGAVVALLVGLAAIIILGQKRRIKAIQEAYKSLPKEIKDQVLELIEESARGGTFVTFLRPDRDEPCVGQREILESHVGGEPYAEAGEEWPVSQKKFLVQVRLSDPGLGDCWTGRLITVFLTEEFELLVRSYTEPSEKKFSAIGSHFPPQPCVRLVPVLFPAEDPPEDEDDIERVEMRWPATPDRICELVPQAATILNRFTDKPSWLLRQILFPGIASLSFEEFEIAY